MDSASNNPPPKQVVNEAAVAKYPPNDFPCRKIGMTWGFLLTYFLSLFGLIVFQKKDIHWMFSLTISLLPALYGAYVGFFSGKLLSRYREPKYAALAGCLLLNATYIPFEVLIILSPWMTNSDHPFQVAKLTVIALGIFVMVIGAAGALLGGIVGIYKRNRLETGKNVLWPQFYLNEMLFGFFLITILFSILTALSQILK